ncbi:hypothetical protein E8E11_004473 [Didymella keratinophila]|nr:hypothetical protein E8E11_004473 [Didymella keratinophila]
MRLANQDISHAQDLGIDLRFNGIADSDALFIFFALFYYLACSRTNGDHSHNKSVQIEARVDKGREIDVDILWTVVIHTKGYSKCFHAIAVQAMPHLAKEREISPRRAGDSNPDEFLNATNLGTGTPTPRGQGAAELLWIEMFRPGYWALSRPKLSHNSNNSSDTNAIFEAAFRVIQIINPFIESSPGPCKEIVALKDAFVEYLRNGYLGDQS